MNTETTAFQSIKLSRLLPKDSPDDPDVWEVKRYEVIDPLPTWIWRDGAPVCTNCRIDRFRSVVLTLRADGETCSCNCGERAMREILASSANTPVLWKHSKI